MSTGLNVLSFIAQSTDLIQSVNETIELRIGIPVFEQELYYMGEKLHSGSTLREYSIIDSDAELKLVDKRQVRDILQNPDHEEAWEELYDFVFLLDTISSEEENNEDLTDLVKETLRDYLKKTPAQFEKAENYIQIFSSSAALSELIIFCGSDIAHHNSCAENLISNLLKWSKELPPPLRRLSAPILVALCKAFSGSSPKYHLNNACRSTLGDLMVFMKLSGDRETTSTTHITLKDLNAILGNVFMDIGRDLTNKVSNRRLNHFCPLRTNVTDLKNFLLPVKNLIGEDLASYRVEDMTSLKDLLSQLIIYLGFCLSKLEELLVDFNIPVGCYEHIAVLHELSTSCQLFQGIEEILWTMLTHRKVVFCYLMINYSRRSDNHEWIYNHKEATTFECRRHLAMFLLPVVEDNSVELPQKEVERSQLWEQSLKYITEAGTDTPQAGLSLKFKDEEAIGAGVRREWFYLVCKELFGSQRDLFRACPNDRRRIFLKSASNVNLDHFKFAGRVIALALMHKIYGIVLDRVLFLQLAEKSVSLEDIRDADPTLYKSCKIILKMDPEKVDQDTLALTFSIDEIDGSGSKKVVGLVHNGENIRVNSKSRSEYVDLLIQYWFVRSVAKQIDQFTKGFNDIISSSKKRRLFFQSLELEDLDWMLHGSGQAISVEDWKVHTEYNGYNETDDQIIWFWQIVEKISAEQRNNLLFFWTSIRYLPREGFTALSPPISIYKTHETSYHLPSSHTCDHQLCFPPYPSSDVMEDRLNTICHEHIYCRFGYV